MAAPESNEHETRVINDSGKERLVILAHESFAIASDDFLKDVREWTAKWAGKYRLESAQLSDKGLKAILVIPVNEPDHSRSSDSAFVEGIFIQSADRTVQSFDIFINLAAENDLKRYKGVAHDILLSIVSGKRKPDLTPGERRLFAFSKELEIAVSVGKNMLVTRQDGSDFLVHRIVALGQLGTPSGSVLIYVGHHPDYEMGERKGEAVVFGKKMEWFGFREGEGLQIVCDLPIPGRDGLKSHIMVNAINEATRAELKHVAESLKLVKPQPTSIK